jgi:hypothetical protein
MDKEPISLLMAIPTQEHISLENQMVSDNMCGRMVAYTLESSRKA